MQQTADAILALINSPPRTPTNYQIVAILARASASPIPTAGTPKLHAEWDALVAELRVAEAKVDAAATRIGSLKAGAISIHLRLQPV